MREQSIPRGSAGTLATLGLMKALSVSGALWMVNKNIPSISPSDIDAFLRGRWTYIPDGLFETIRPVSENLDYLYGDCDDAAVIAAAFLLRANFGRGETREPRVSASFVALRHMASQEFNHVLVMAEDPQGTFLIDPTAPKDADYSRWEQLALKIF